jgi:hypothetical protein
MVAHIGRKIKRSVGLDGSSVGIATGLRLDDRASILNRDKEMFLFSMTSRPALGPTHPPVQWVSFPPFFFSFLEGGVRQSIWYVDH